MKTFFAIALLCAASLTDAMSTITRIDSSLNEIAPSVGRVLQGGSLINDAPVDTTVRSNDVGVPMGGGLVGNLLLTRLRPWLRPWLRLWLRTRKQQLLHVSRIRRLRSHRLASRPSSLWCPHLAVAVHRPQPSVQPKRHFERIVQWTNKVRVIEKVSFDFG
ncbi:hypothetical protein MTO96_001819 [Rhipicephalus appendiculatus]